MNRRKFLGAAAALAALPATPVTADGGDVQEPTNERLPPRTVGDVAAVESYSAPEFAVDELAEVSYEVTGYPEDYLESGGRWGVQVDELVDWGNVGMYRAISFNPERARELGLLLIEAAEVCEAAGDPQ